MTLVFIFNQYDIEPGPSYVGTADGGRGRVAWSLIRLEGSGPKGSRLMFHVKRVQGVKARGRERFTIQRIERMQYRGLRQRFTVYRLSKASMGRERTVFKLDLIGRARPRKARLRGVRP
jgi:hypothetical protein